MKKLWMTRVKYAHPGLNNNADKICQRTYYDNACNLPSNRVRARRTSSCDCAQNQSVQHRMEREPPFLSGTRLLWVLKKMSLIGTLGKPSKLRKYSSTSPHPRSSHTRRRALHLLHERSTAFSFSAQPWSSKV